MIVSSFLSGWILIEAKRERVVVFAGMTVIDLEYNVLLLDVYCTLCMLCLPGRIGEKQRQIKARLAPASAFGSLDATTQETPPTLPLRNC